MHAVHAGLAVAKANGKKLGRPNQVGDGMGGRKYLCDRQGNQPEPPDYLLNPEPNQRPSWLEGMS